MVERNTAYSETEGPGEPGRMSVRFAVRTRTEEVHVDASGAPVPGISPARVPSPVPRAAVPARLRGLPAPQRWARPSRTGASVPHQGEAEGARQSGSSGPTAHRLALLSDELLTSADIQAEAQGQSAGLPATVQSPPGTTRPRHGLVPNERHLRRVAPPLRIVAAAVGVIMMIVPVVVALAYPAASTSELRPRPAVLRVDQHDVEAFWHTDR